MSAVGDTHQAIRFHIKDVTKPLQMNLSILPGHTKVMDKNKISEAYLCSTIIKRWYMSEDVIREPVRIGRLRGTLFIPKGTYCYITSNSNQ